MASPTSSPSDFTDPAVTALQDLAVLQEIGTAIKERKWAANHDPGTVWDFTEGHDLQYVGVDDAFPTDIKDVGWKTIQAAIEELISGTFNGWLKSGDPDGSSSYEVWTIQKVAEHLHGTGVTSPWRRKKKESDSFSYGKMVGAKDQTGSPDIAGDIIGPWIIWDIQHVLVLLTQIVRTTFSANQEFSDSDGDGTDENQDVYVGRDTIFAGANCADAKSSAESDWQLADSSSAPGIAASPFEPFAQIDNGGGEHEASMSNMEAWPADSPFGDGTFKCDLKFYIFAIKLDAGSGVTENNFEASGHNVTEDKWSKVLTESGVTPTQAGDEIEGSSQIGSKSTMPPWPTCPATDDTHQSGFQDDKRLTIRDYAVTGGFTHVQ